MNGRVARLHVAVAGALIVLSAFARSASAQSIAGVVRDSLSHLPISGAVISLFDSAGVASAHTLTNERGEYRVALTAAGRRMRAVRIGFEPRDLPLPNSTVDGAVVEFSMLALPTMLKATHIIANARCPVRKDREAALGLWEQARAGLLATVVTREENPALLHRLLFDRIMDGNGERIESMRVQADSQSASTSFMAAHSAQDLVRFGFATDSTNTATYFGPDADVLLSEYFADAYCFQLADGSRARPSQVGLHFVPVDYQHGRTDIDGTLWIDTAARTLHDVDYRYLGVPRAAEAFHPGGHVEFREVRPGVVLIDRWWIRLVSAAQDTQLVATVRGPRERLRPRIYAEEMGGELARATWRDGLAWQAALGALRVKAVTAEGKPAMGTIVALVASPYYGTADSTGAVNIRELLSGPYDVRIIDPRIAELGIGIPTPVNIVAVRDSTITATLKVSTAESFIAGRCVTARQWTVGDSVFVLGRVVTPDGKPVPDAKVTFATVISRGKPEFHDDYYETGTDGLFQSCRGWDVGDEVLIRVHRPEAANVDVTRTIDSNLLAVRIVVQPLH
jgi:hypothetical protein